MRQRRVAQLLVYLRPNNQSNSNLTLPTHSHNVREIEVFFGPPADRKVRREHVVIIWYPVLPRPLLTLTPSTSHQAVLGALQPARSHLDFER